MSIWCSVGGDDIHALHNTSPATNYDSEGEHTTVVDVALGNGKLIRLAMFDFTTEPTLSEQVLLTPAAARELATRLERAATATERETARMADQPTQGT